MSIYIDADACPVKDEIYRVARRYETKVFVVSNATIFVPRDVLIEAVVVPSGLDLADDWIVEHVSVGDIVVTTDIPLAERALNQGSRVISPKGVEFNETTIGNALATRALLELLRQGGEFKGGPSAFLKSDRSTFLAKLDEMIHAARRDIRRKK